MYHPPSPNNHCHLEALQTTGCEGACQVRCLWGWIMIIDSTNWNFMITFEFQKK